MVRYDFDLNELVPPGFSHLHSKQVIKPFNRLHEFIDAYVILNNHDVESTSTYKILPDLSGYFIFYLIQNKTSYTYKFQCIGPRSKYIEITRKNRQTTIIVKFKPGGIFSFLPFPVEEIRDSSLAMNEIYQEELATFFNDIAYCPVSDTNCYIPALEQFLTQCFDPEKKIHQKILSFLALSRTHNALKVQTASKQLGISERYLHKLTTEQIGLNPKRMFMVERVLCSLACASSTRHPIPDIHFMLGYYDQAHMIDEYVELLGVTPGRLFKELEKE